MSGACVVVPPGAQHVGPWRHRAGEGGLECQQQGRRREAPIAAPGDVEGGVPAARQQHAQGYEDGRGRLARGTVDISHPSPLPRCRPGRKQPIQRLDGGIDRDDLALEAHA